MSIKSYILTEIGQINLKAQIKAIYPSDNGNTELSKKTSGLTPETIKYIRTCFDGVYRSYLERLGNFLNLSFRENHDFVEFAPKCGDVILNDYKIQNIQEQNDAKNSVTYVCGRLRDNEATKVYVKKNIWEDQNRDEVRDKYTNTPGVRKFIDNQCSPNFYIVYDFFEKHQPPPVSTSNNPRQLARQLEGDQIEELRDAILKAFPNEEDLKEVVRIMNLNFNYDGEVSGVNYKNRIFNMIEHRLEPNYDTKDLFEKLLTRRPKNEMLKACKRFWEST
jgi:hypothetical protein